jgi:hypothetical protein
MSIVIGTYIVCVVGTKILVQFLSWKIRLVTSTCCLWVSVHLYYSFQLFNQLPCFHNPYYERYADVVLSNFLQSVLLVAKAPTCDVVETSVTVAAFNLRDTNTASKRFS